MIRLTEGGAMAGVGAIHADEIEPTLDSLEKVLGIDLKNNTLGSVGKKEFSGDIDIALEIAPDDIPDFLEKLKIETSSLNIHMGIYDIPSLDPKNKVTKRLIISGWNQCQIFLDYMYNGSSIFLNRKFEKYNYIKNIKNQIAMGTFIDG